MSSERGFPGLFLVAILVVMIDNRTTDGTLILYHHRNPSHPDD